MAGGVTLQVRQIGSYPLAGPAGAGDLLLMQPGGLGNPYAAVDAQTLVSSALSNGSLGVGVTATGNEAPGNVLAGAFSVLTGESYYWNAYGTPQGEAVWGSSPAARIYFSPPYGFEFGIGPQGLSPGQPITEWSPLFTLSPAGAATLPLGTLMVARDPGGALEVATAGWVGRNTVASFNGRNGAVTLNGCDILSALCLPSIASQEWVCQQIQASVEMLLANHPFVFGWNGRTGAVYLTLADISCVFFQPGQQPITQTPPLTSNDYSIPNTAWVVEYIANEFAGGGGNLATQSWVLANTVNSFNGRQGVVTLTSADVYDVGAAPLNSPQFSGIPTAPTAPIGQATGQIATTAFVQQAISESTAGVASFNGRTGIVTLTNADITTAGGLANPSPNLTGNPTAPTQAPGTSTPVIANCEFVMAAIAAGTVASFNGRTGTVTLALSDVTGVGGAPLASPALSGTPTAPTAAPGTNTTQLATTQFVSAALAAAGGVSSFNSRTGAVTLEANDVSAVGGLINPSVGLTGTPTAPTAAPGTNTTQIASTAFVTAALAAGAVTSFNTRTGAVTLALADITGAGGAPLASPALTGTPTAPTATAGTNNTQIATTAYVTAAIAADTTGVTSFNTRVGAVTLLGADITGAGGALLAGPAFTGIPTAPTATAGTSTTQLATCAFVQAAVGAGAVTSWNSRTGAVNLQANDLSAVGGALLASPAFTGTPTVPTAAAGTNTTQAASTAFVTAATTTGSAFIAENYVDNSSFVVNQRAYISGTALAAGIYGPDRWKGGASGATLTFSATPSATVVTITAGSLQQVISADTMLGGPYTLSWTGTATGRISTTSGGGTYAASPIQFTGTATTQTYIEFTGGTLSRVQLQIGTQATPWQPSPPQVEFARCQRHYQTGLIALWAGGPTGTVCTITNQLPVTMRATPTAVGNGTTSVNVSGASLTAAGPGALQIAYNIVSGASGAAWAGSWTATADL